MKKINYIGLDMDHTLIRYNIKNFEALVYQLVIEELIETKHYPTTIRQLEFEFDDAIRGLVIDSKNGNILKLSRYGAIRHCCHGTRPMDFTEQNQFYRSTYVDLNDPNYMVIDTSFSIAFCVLYGHLVDLKDDRPLDLPSYDVVARDVLSALDTVHAKGDLKATISQQPEKFIIQEPQLVKDLKRYSHYGKKFFIITNSGYQYCKNLLDYAINPFLDADEHWENIFEYVITFANKPRFFYDNLNFLSIDPKTGTMTNTQGSISPGIYQGGSAKKFADDLGLKGDEILYIGDHIYGDIIRLKKECNWRTALVVEELGAEIAAQKKSIPIEHELMAEMATKRNLEQEIISLQTLSIEEKSPQNDNKIHDLHAQIIELDSKIARLIKQQQVFFNHKWGRMFRAGAEESFFAYQVERYACIYMEKLSDLLTYSPLTYFRAHRRLLPHDLI